MDGSSVVICSQSVSIASRSERSQGKTYAVPRAARWWPGLLELVLAAGDEHRDAAGLRD